MPITINGSGTIGGLNAGGLPDDCITTADIAANAVTYAKIGTTEQGQLCKAWVNFNGTGTVAIRASYNVSSITDNGVGLYTLNFTTAMPDANYIVTGSTVGNALNEGQFVSGANNSSSQSTSSAQFAVIYCTNGARNDVGQVNVTVFR
jgi:hypothetical protein